MSQSYEIKINNHEVTIPKPNSFSLDVIESKTVSYNDFFEKYMIKNIPCIVKNISSDWDCVGKWIKEEQINYDYFVQHYGDIQAPVADCNNVSYNSHCKCEMKVSDYMNYLKSENKDKLLYLKDWHLRRLQPTNTFYNVPIFFSSDWLNEYAQDHQDDDYMFVYIGPKDSWTPLHADVYCSYSWSVNIIGKKKWILFPPGEEIKIQGSSLNLPMLFDNEQCNDINYYEVIQEKGDGLFVPSGWYHQVVNVLDTISINHNWINACNIDHVWNALQKNIICVQHEIEEFKNTEEFDSQCQLILKTVFGMDFEMFAQFLCYIGNKRLRQLQSGNLNEFDTSIYSINHIKFDIRTIEKVIGKMVNHTLFPNKNVIQIKTEKELLFLKNSILQQLNMK